MSAGGPGQREVAHRLFAAEFDDATFTYAESDEDRAPNYVVTPTGAQVNRLFLVGVLTETEWVNEETLRARVVDPTGPYVLYASQYQPDARGALDGADPPAFLAVTGKANTFRPDGADRVYSSVRPEAVATVDAPTRDRWAVSTAEQTIVRLGRLSRALQSNETTDRGIELARREYAPTPAYLAALYERAIDVLRLVAGEIDTLPDRPIAPDMAEEPSTPLEDIVAAATRLGLEAEPTATVGVGSAGDAPEPEAAEPDPSSQTDEPEEDTATPPTNGSDAPEATPDPTTEDEATPAPDDDETGTTVTQPVSDAEEEPPEEVLTTEEREEIESSFGTDFTTGDEIDPPETDDQPEGVEKQEPTTSSEDIHTPAEEPDSTTVESTPESGESEESSSAEEAAELSVDELTELMRELDQGEGVARDELIEAATDRFGVAADDAAETLQGALLAGRCYEAGDEAIRPI